MQENQSKQKDSLIRPAGTFPSAGESKKKPVNFFLFFELGIEFAVILALPLIGAVYLGKWLDAKYNTKFIIIICLLTALALSWYMIFKKINEIRKIIK